MTPCLILDGSMGHALKSNEEIWDLSKDLKIPFDKSFVLGAVANALKPDIVAEMHRQYVSAGADIITTNTFACTHWALKSIQRSDEAVELAISGARLAREVADEAERPILVAGCLPPLQESYQVVGRTQLEVDQPEYKELATALSPYVDVFLCETMSTISEAMAATSAAACIPHGPPWWVSFTLQDNQRGVLRSEEPLTEAVSKLKDIRGMDGVLVNCCAPQSISAALPILAQSIPEGARFGGYPNAFQETTSSWLGEGSSTDGGDFVCPPPSEYDESGILLPEALKSHGKLWIQNGASIIGACCGSSPEHIAKLAELKQESTLCL